MEYFSSHVHGVHENMSLQDMIECDIKSEFNEHEGGHSSGHSDSIHMQSSIPESVAMDYTPHEAGAGSEIQIMSSVVSMSSSHLPESVQPQKVSSALGDDLSWLETVNVSDIQSSVLQADVSSDGHTLLVNPQTALPVQHVQENPELKCVQAQPQVAPSPMKVDPEELEDRIPSPIATISLPSLTASRQQQQLLLQTVSQMNNIDPTTVTITRTLAQPITTAQTILHVSRPQQIQSVQTQPQVTRVYQQPLTTQQLLVSSRPNKTVTVKTDHPLTQKTYPKPVYSYSCLIAMALKNSETGALPVSEIYNFMTENFPYFKTAPDGWKNSVRHNLSLNKCFEKIDNPKANGTTRKGCLWGLNPEKIEKMDEEITKWRKKDEIAVKRSMSKPELLEVLEKGRIGSSSPRHPNNLKASQKIVTTCASARNNINNNNKNSVGVANLNGVTKIINITPSCTTTPITTTNSLNYQPSIIRVINPDDVKGATVTAKVEDVAAAAANGNADELQVLEGNLELEGSLPELTLQGMWDEFGAEGITLDDLPITASSLNFNFPPGGTASPTPESSAGTNASPLVTLLTNRSVQSSPAASGISFSRTISAQM